MAAPLVHVDESKTAGEPAEVETVDDADVHPSKGMCDSIPVLGPCCGVWNKFGLTGQTLIAVVLGFLLGLLMRDIKPSKDWIQLVGYPGEIFVRSLKLLVVPMIATCMVIAIGNLGELSKIKFIGTRALAYYLSTTGIGCLVGIAFANIFEPGKATGDQVIAAKAAALLIANNMTSMVVLDTTTKYDDLAGNKETIDVFLDIGRSLVPDNITAALADTNILGIITFFLCVGFAINHQNTDESRRVLSFFSTLNDSFMYLVTGVIVMTPLGVASLVASEVSKQEDLWTIIGELGMLILATACGILFQALIVYPTYYVVFCRKNPYPYLKNMGQAIMTAFATSSSAATLPVTLRCVEENNNISQEITRFVLPLGATVNMDGTAIYYPIAVIFVANIQGMYLSFGEQITVAIVSAFVSIGAAPIPSAGLVYLILIMAAVNVPITDSISFVMSVDWLLDRFQTCCNITGDAFGAAILDQKRIENEDRMAKKKQAMAKV